MRNILYLLPVLLIAACSDGNIGGSLSYDPYKERPDYYPQIQDTPYKDTVSDENAEITGMITKNDDQVKKYITARLKKFSSDNISTNDYMDIAQMAVQLTNATDKQISEFFEQDADVLHAAMFVINQELGNCFNGASASSTVACFTNWRDGLQYAVNVAEILENADVLDITDAKMTDINGKQLTFGVDALGDIISVTISDGSDDGTTYETLHNSDGYVTGSYQFWHSDTGAGRMSKLTYNSIGKDMGLQYSDFGFYNIVHQTLPDIVYVDDPDNAYVIFTGGYESKNIATVTTDVNFSGRAIGLVKSGKDGGGRLTLDGLATLTFDTDAKETNLFAEFNNWYDVNVTQNADGTNMKFTQYKPNGAYDMRLTTQPDETGNLVISDGKMNVQYYGPYGNAGTPTEAIGTVTFDEGADGVKMDMAFGVH